MNLKVDFCVVIALSVVVSFASCKLTGRIVGGLAIPIEAVPYQVSMQYLTMGRNAKHFCGGSVIAPNFIASAGHCVYGLNERDIQILAGTTHNDRNGVKKLVKRIIRHEKYNHTDQNYDIALLELSSPLKYSESIRPIALPSANQSFPDHLMCLVSGWGDTQSFILNLFGRTDLRAVEVPIVNQNKCEKYYENVGLEITPQMACAGFDRGGADSCQGDSGGPLACPTPSTKRSSPPVLFGIVSWGAKCAEPYLPGVYTRVPTVREWIFAKTGV